MEDEVSEISAFRHHDRKRFVTSIAA